MDEDSRREDSQHAQHHHRDQRRHADGQHPSARKTDGVAGATVNFMTQKMIVEFAEGADAKQVMQAVLKACRKVEPDCEIELG